ncbi:MAG: hypothetical protein KC635_28615 [Myxococcales bacterium]|nr:hypothetical protein [Myxococcales bacterium]MCB9733493.1 hypothetical protein [Deltaproteobacteria bacterium]
MSAAFAFEPSPIEPHPAAGRASAVPASVVCGRGHGAPASSPVDGFASRLGATGFLLAAPLDLAPGAFAWVRLTLADGSSIRPLVQVVARREEGLSCRIQHLFPSDRRALDAHLAA